MVLAGFILLYFLNIPYNLKINCGNGIFFSGHELRNLSVFQNRGCVTLPDTPLHCHWQACFVRFIITCLVMEKEEGGELRLRNMTFEDGC